MRPTGDCLARRRGRSIRRTILSAPRAGNGSSDGSTSPNTPARANTKPARAQTREMGDRADHKRQPECSATMPPVMGLNVTRRKPAAWIMSAKTVGRGNFLIDSARY